MPREVIRTGEAPSNPLYSQGVKAGRFVYVTGMWGADVKTGTFAGPTVQEQARQALINCEHILRAGGATRDDVVAVHVLLVRPEDFSALNEEYAKFFPVDPPIRYVSKLGAEIPGMLV